MHTHSSSHNVITHSLIQSPKRNQHKYLALLLTWKGRFSDIRVTSLSSVECKTELRKNMEGKVSITSLPFISSKSSWFGFWYINLFKVCSLLDMILGAFQIFSHTPVLNTFSASMCKVRSRWEVRDHAALSKWSKIWVKRQTWTPYSWPNGIMTLPC